MAEIRQFGTEMSRPIPTPGVEGVQASAIQIPAQIAGLLGQAELAERYQGVPIVVDRPVGVFALFFDAHARIHEHDAEHDILFVVIGGSGTKSPCSRSTTSPGGSTRSPVEDSR